MAGNPDPAVQAQEAPMTQYGLAIAVALGSLTLAAAVSPWPAELAALAAVANVALASGLLIDALRHAPHFQRALPRWTLALSFARLAVALCAIRATAFPEAAGTAKLLFATPFAAIFAAVAAAGASILAALLIGAGAVRVAEVAARFALDSIPGKQLGIDTAVQAGGLAPQAAAEGMTRIEMEAAFYASMDGALRFLRAEAIAIPVVVSLSTATGAATHPDLWTVSVGYGATLAAVLLIATVLATYACMVAITAPCGTVPDAAGAPPQQIRAVAAVCGGIALAILLAGSLTGGPKIGEALAAFVLGAAGWALWRISGYGGPQPGRTPAATLLSSGLSPTEMDTLTRSLEELRAELRLRLGFDPGEIDLRQLDGTTPSTFRLLVRGLDLGMSFACPGAYAIVGEGPHTAPDGRPIQWSDQPGTAGLRMSWEEIVRWWAFRLLVANAELLFSYRSAAWLAGEVNRHLSGLTGLTMNAAAVFSIAQPLLARGLPLPTAELLADAVGVGEEAPRRLHLTQTAVRVLLSASGGQCLARQLHPDSRRLLRDLAGGAFAGPELEALRASIIAEAWLRPNWRWPLLLIDEEHVAVLERLLADHRAEVVVLAPDELPAGVALPTIEVLGSGSA
ncbi:MAG: FHIPEP family type III secretion protein [Armatimonadetes bacterium]|nr:FHIPEP family type III secretion protein [Armatimonadota bacterium]